MRNVFHARSRAAFSLVELLVVIAILGILVGLLLPAVQRVRDSGRRMACANNLRQLGQGMAGHESAFGTFPAGRRGADGNGIAESGFVAILPYIDEQPLFDTLRLTGTFGLWHPNASQLNATGSACWGPDAATQARVRAAVRQRPAVFVCPADSISQPLNTVSGTFNPVVSATSAGTSSYAMCGGRTEVNVISYEDGVPDQGDDGLRAVNAGMFENQFGRAKEQVFDGLAKTFLLGETFDTHSFSEFNLWSVARSNGPSGGPANAILKAVGGGNDPTVPSRSAIRCCLCPPNSRLTKQDCGRGYSSPIGTNLRYVTSTSGSTGRYKGFDSLHPGGLVFVFADGHTQFIDDQINLRVYQALSTADGAAVNAWERVDVP